MITIYTDGASRGNPGPGGYGAVIAYNKKQESGVINYEWATEIGGREDHTTNNRMELMAAIEALKYLNLPSLSNDQVSVYTDSEYLMKGMTEWIKKWQVKGWKTAGRKSVLNQDLWQVLLSLVEGKNIEWKYVAGHSGERYNERSDEIATSFADGLIPSLYDGPKNQYK